MKAKSSTKVIRVNKETMNKMNEYYEDTKRDKTPPYAVFQADDNDTVVTLYNSGKAMFQGVSADIVSEMWLAMQEGVDFEFDNTKPTKKEKEINIPININSIGSDEVGTGDYFGPIVVTASYVNKANIEFLEELGVKDSKKMSDEKILQIVPKIAKVIPYKTIILSNKDYNKYYGKNMNMNKIKAILHNKVLCQITKENNYQYDYIVIDQFEPEKSFYNHIEDANEKIQNVTFITKAEDKCLSVAVSSLISRYVFLKQMDKLSDKYDIFLPKGANSYVDDIAIKLVQKHGDKILENIAKLNFSNTERVMKYK